MLQAYKKFIASFIILTSFSIYGFDLTGEGINLSGKINSTSLTDSGGVIDVVSDNEKYGKTWLTYNVKVNNPNSPDQGSFQGRAIAINNDGLRVSASRQGVWSREGYIYSFYSLDDVSDGNQFLCITTMNLKDDTVEMRFYPK
ncbi:MAG: hypothetical protein P8O01_04795 [SAR86 cluster bacterium]|jgi:uncharacterized membrane protein|nr:hypothetical protein [SAR86 cluster bacterium]|tara:strand:+ start:4189 stop:4617 length:429 start_codon:yes stop_codon:yes gene_type:complete